MPESTPTVNRWTITRKAAVIRELLRAGGAVKLARKHGLSQAQLFAWRERFLEGGQAALETRRGRGEQDRLARELARNVGQLILGRVRRPTPRAAPRPHRGRGSW